MFSLDAGMGIYKFGSNTYPWRIRCRSNIGHIFQEKKGVLWAGKYGTLSNKMLSLIKQTVSRLKFNTTPSSSNIAFRPAILTEEFCTFPQSLQVNVGITPLNPWYKKLCSMESCGFKTPVSGSANTLPL